MKVLCLLVGWALLLVLFPFVWLLTLPFRLLAVLVEAAFALVRAILLLPARLLGGGSRPR